MHYPAFFVVFFPEVLFAIVRFEKIMLYIFEASFKLKPYKYFPLTDVYRVDNKSDIGVGPS